MYETQWNMLTQQDMSELIVLAGKYKLNRLAQMVGNRLTTNIVYLDHPDVSLKPLLNNKLFSDKIFIVEGKDQLFCYH